MENEVALTTASLMPQTQEAKYKMACTLAKSGLIPQGLNTPEKVFVALQWGHELGLSPMVAVNNVAVINGKPTLSADIMAAIVKRSPEYGGIKWLEMSDRKAECEITRILPNGEKETQKSCFSIEDAERAGLANRDVWKKYTKRMLKHRCLSAGLKDMFPDLLAGLYDPEEMESVDEEKHTDLKNVTPEPTTQEIETELTESTDKQDLIKLIETYEKELSIKSASNPVSPYDQCCEALAENDSAKISKCLTKCKTYLTAKGFMVA